MDVMERPELDNTIMLAQGECSITQQRDIPVVTTPWAVPYINLHGRFQLSLAVLQKMCRVAGYSPTEFYEAELEQLRAENARLTEENLDLSERADQAEWAASRYYASQGQKQIERQKGAREQMLETANNRIKELEAELAEAKGEHGDKKEGLAA